MSKINDLFDQFPEQAREPVVARNPKELSPDYSTQLGGSANFGAAFPQNVEGDASVHRKTSHLDSHGHWNIYGSGETGDQSGDKTASGNPLVDEKSTELDQLNGGSFGEGRGRFGKRFADNSPKTISPKDNSPNG